MRKQLSFFKFVLTVPIAIILTCDCSGGILSANRKVLRVVEGMSLKEKVCQMFIIRPETLACPSDPRSIGRTALDSTMIALYRGYPAGGFCLFDSNVVSPEQLLQFTTDLHSLSLRPLLCVDEEGGRVVRIANTPSFDLKRYKSAAALASDGDAKRVSAAAEYIGSYVSAYGFDVDFAPVADVNTNPDNVVIGERAFSDNPNEAATMVVSYLEGLRKSGIIGCMKHFPGHGDTKGDTHLGYAASGKTWEEMDSCEMITFKAGIAAGARMIMVAHIAAPKVTGSDVPSTMSPVVVREKLRGELGYDGIIITDAMEMAAIRQACDQATAAVEAVRAGVDIILMPSDYIQAVEGVVQAVVDGIIPESRIDESVRRILLLKKTCMK